MNTTATRTAGVLTVTYPDGTTETVQGKSALTAAAISTGTWSDGARCLSLHKSIAAGFKNARTNAAPAHPGGEFWRNAETAVVRDI